MLRHLLLAPTTHTSEHPLPGSLCTSCCLPDSTQEGAWTSQPLNGSLGNMSPYPRPLSSLWMLTDAQTPPLLRCKPSLIGRPPPGSLLEDVASLQVSPQAPEAGGQRGLSQLLGCWEQTESFLMDWHLWGTKHKMPLIKSLS